MNDPHPSVEEPEPEPEVEREELSDSRATGSLQERMVHELTVHQIELEVQNRALQEAQTELEQSRLRYVDLYDFAPVAYLTLEEDGTIVDLNLAAATLIGRDRAVLVGRRFQTTLALSDPLAFRNILHRSPIDATPVRAQLSLRNVLGRSMVVEVVASPAGLGDEATGRTRVALVDVTERVRAELGVRFLSEAGAHLSRIGMGEPHLGEEIAAAGAGGIVDGCWIQLSDGSEAVAWRSESLRRRVGQAELIRLKGYMQRTIREAVATGQAVVGAWPAEEKGQSRHPHLLRPHFGRWVSYPLRVAGQTAGSATLLFERGPEFHEDEGRALAAEFGRRASTVLENDRLYRETKEAVRAREELMAVLAHDMSNALFAIRLNAQRGLLQGASPSTRILATIARGAQWLLSMVGTLLDVSGLETGQFRLRIQSCDLATILDEASGLQQPMADERGIHLRRVWGPGLSALVDRERILQVLFNLLGNALKFTEAGGEVELGAESETGFVRLWVRDTGVGLDAEQVSRIFDRGWQAHPEEGGKGLGLYIAKRIVEAHEGRIWAESAPTVGTRVFIRLPVTEARSPSGQ